MNANVCFLAVLLTLCFHTSSPALDQPPAPKTNEQWQVHIYPKIGLKIRLPNWKPEIEDQDRMWCLLAYPLVENPTADVQYRVMISANKYTESQYLRLIRNYATNSSDWLGSEHLQTSQMTNAFWSYTRRDVYRAGGFSYPCTGRIKRIQVRKTEDLARFGGNEEQLAAEVRRILDSIEVISTNPAHTSP